MAQSRYGISWGGKGGDNGGQRQRQQAQAQPQGRTKSGLAWGAAQTSNRGSSGRSSTPNRFAVLAEELTDSRAPQEQTGGRTSTRGVTFGSAARSSNRGGQAGPSSRSQGQQGGGWAGGSGSDKSGERPGWPFSCYSHIRARAEDGAPSEFPGGGGGPNDLEGDVSFEELRWSQLQALRSGAPPDDVATEFAAGAANLTRQLQASCNSALQGATRPPSLGGPRIPPLPFPPAAAAGPFTSTPAFGQPIQANATGPFPAPRPFGREPPATPFGQTVGAFGRNPSVVPPSGFVQQGPFGASSLGPGAQATPGFGMPSGFGSAAPAVAHPGPFAAASGAMAENGGGEQTPPGGEENIWTAKFFEKGKIPEEPPPAIYCR